MPIEYRPSETWPADRTQDEATVIGDESDVVGDESDSAAAFVETLFGPPHPQIRDVVCGAARVSRSASYTVQVRRVADEY